VKKKAEGDAPVWPPHLAEYVPERDGWRCRCEFRDARCSSARRYGFDPLPMIQAMTAEPATGAEAGTSCVGCAYRYERFPWLRKSDEDIARRRAEGAGE
jgi:hypothetical protein